MKYGRAQGDPRGCEPVALHFLPGSMDAAPATPRGVARQTVLTGQYFGESPSP